MKKIIVFGFTDNVGGIETFYMSYLKKINLKKYSIDFVTVAQNMAFEEEVKKYGSKVFKVHNFKRHPFLYTKEISKIIEEGKYDIVHVNMLSSANILPLKIAKKKRVKKIIAHVHNNKIPFGIVRRIMDLINNHKIQSYATELVACSEDAGKWMFKKNKFVVLKNAIEIDRFVYHKEWREQIRKKFNLTDDVFLVGHVGRFSKEKNQKLLIQIFKKINNKKIVLMMIGNGKDKENIKNGIRKKHLENNVIIVDNTKDINRYYSAFDLFVFPSLFEGLGIVALEAQVSGLDCIFSDALSKEININKNNQYLSLSDVDSWCKVIENMASKKNTREFNYELFNEKGYDINTEYIELEQIYDS